MRYSTILLEGAMASDYLDQFEGYLKLALRAQVQSRATIGTLAELKNPPIMGYVKQANIAHGPQQCEQRSDGAKWSIERQ